MTNYLINMFIMTVQLFPIILAGGSGTRLWPLSRKNFPKQFLCLQSDESLLQQTIRRVETLNVAQSLLVGNEAHYFLCQEQLASSQLKLTYLLEPCARNTAPAIATAAFHLQAEYGSDAVMLILPSDHWIGNVDKWQAMMQQGVELAYKSDLIITFGIKPDSPKTGYGYIEAGIELTHQAFEVISFREKPTEAIAKELVAQSNFYWNSGMFVCKVGVYLTELNKLAPDIAEQSFEAFTKASKHHDFIRLNESAFSLCRNESIDYALMEHTQKAAILPLDLPWSDLGCWNSVAEAQGSDANGNTLLGNVVAQNSNNCLIRSEEILVTTMGLSNQIIIATPDAVLVADKSYAQEVKTLVDSLRLEHRAITEDHLRVSRPWGYYEVLAEGANFKVKRLMVKPGAKLSLQQHQHRAEHWVIVSGQAEIINGKTLQTLSVNQSTYIPPQTKHRLANHGNEPLFVIEVQSGNYLGEDDIQRFDDIYARTVETI